MTNSDWLQLYDEKKDSFRWFFMQYGFSFDWELLEEYRSVGNIDSMIVVMNRIWFLLPDNRFNIMTNPEGWSEFITLLEEYYEVNN